MKVKNGCNKALIYQNYYNSRIALFVGAILFFICSFSIFSEELRECQINISSFATNKLNFTYSLLIFVMIITLTVIYVNMKGFNKRNAIIFLTTGPYKKWDIKKSEIISILAVLLLFVFIFFYSSICTYMNSKILIEIIPTYWKEVIFILIRLLTVGILYIMYMIFMDTLFSNTLVTILFMVITPFVVLLDCVYILKMISYFEFISDLSNKISKFIDTLLIYLFSDTMDYSQIYLFDEKRTLFICIAVTILLSFIIFYLIKIINNKITINNINRIFTHDVIELVFLMIYVFSGLILITLVFTIKNISISIDGSFLLIIILLVEIFISYKISVIIKTRLDKFL